MTTHLEVSLIHGTIVGLNLSELELFVCGFRVRPVNPKLSCRRVNYLKQSLTTT